MTLRSLTVALRRHWVVTVALIFAAAPVLLLVATRPPIYTSRAAVYFMQPASSREPNVLGTTRTSVISTAGVVQRSVQGHTTTQVISDDVSLTDMGVREGTFVRLPNSGGQWANNFETPALIVEAVDSTPQAVEKRMTDTITAIDASLARLQRDTGAGPTTLITTKAEPENLTVVAVSGSRKRALLYLTLLVVGLVVSVTVLLETRHAISRSPGLPRITPGRSEAHA